MIELTDEQAQALEHAAVFAKSRTPLNRKAMIVRCGRRSVEAALCSSSLLALRGWQPLGGLRAGVRRPVSERVAVVLDDRPAGVRFSQWPLFPVVARGDCGGVRAGTAARENRADVGRAAGPGVH